MGGSRLKSQGRISPSPLLSTPVQIPGRHPGGREWDERDEAGGDPAGLGEPSRPTDSVRTSQQEANAAASQWVGNHNGDSESDP
ncbi:hypothetical protein CLOM_g15175 [Closterium sp. NIES-68]|nr:hypothetical protein CLOM_g15175 [Closterium sp. NIES-68]